MPLQLELAADESDDLVTFSCEDISIGGLRARGRLLIGRGEQVLVLVSDEGRQIPVLARVIDADASIRDGLIGLRMRFEHISGGARVRLDRLIRDAATRTGGRVVGDLRAVNSSAMRGRPPRPPRAV